MPACARISPQISTIERRILPLPEKPSDASNSRRRFSKVCGLEIRGSTRKYRNDKEFVKELQNKSSYQVSTRHIMAISCHPRFASMRRRLPLSCGSKPDGLVSSSCSSLRIAYFFFNSRLRIKLRALGHDAPSRTCLRHRDSMNGWMSSAAATS